MFFTPKRFDNVIYKMVAPSVDKYDNDVWCYTGPYFLKLFEKKMYNARLYTIWWGLWLTKDLSRCYNEWLPYSNLNANLQCEYVIPFRNI